MVGYSMTSKAYRLFNTTTRTVIEQRDVLFDENLFGADDVDCNNNNEKNLKADDYFVLCVEQSVGDNDSDVVDNKCRPSVQKVDREEFFDAEANNVDSGDDNEQQQPSVGPGRPKLIRSGKPGRSKKKFNTNQTEKNEIYVAMDENIPQTVEEAFSSKNKQFWKKAMEDEFLALRKNKTWKLMNLPEGHKPIPCKWVFALKRGPNGEVERYKARLVAKGCNQRFGVDFNETFSPVVRYSTIRLLLALAVKNKMHLHQMDVSTAYLNSNLQDEIYMQQPPNFVDDKCPNKVLRLNKAIYGLKQSGKEWNSKLDGVLRKMNFVPCDNEPCLYKSTVEGNLVLIAVYVDDLVVGCSNLSIVCKVKADISSNFEVNDKGPLSYFLGMEIERKGDTGAIKLSQTQYILDILKKYGMDECKPVAVPLEAGYQAKCDGNCDKFDQHEYQSLIGALMYLAISTRPDLLHSISKMAQRNSDPHIEHMTKLKHILRYLSGTRDLKLVYQTNGCGLEGFVDADWAGNSEDRKSYTGFVFYYCGSPVSWESRKQSSVALSSTEAEYMAASEAAKEAVYLKRLLSELKEDIHDPAKLP